MSDSSPQPPPEGETKLTDLNYRIEIVLRKISQQPQSRGQRATQEWAPRNAAKPCNSTSATGNATPKVGVKQYSNAQAPVLAPSAALSPAGPVELPGGL